MELFGGELLAKEGAEGFYSMALAPALAATLTGAAEVADDVAVGIALKIEDGSMNRGRNPVIMRTLHLLGLPQLNWDGTLRNHAGTVVGEVRAEFELETL
jgi:L-asparaginase II